MAILYFFLGSIKPYVKLLRLLDAGKLPHDFEMYKKQSGFLGLLWPKPVRKELKIYYDITIYINDINYINDL